jgi:iron-sulfur cluster protein
MGNINDYKINPRQVADKSTKGALHEAITLALEVETDALRLNTQTFNRNKYNAVQKINDYQELKDRVRKIKEDAIENLPVLVDKLTKTIETRGGKVFFANSKEEATDYIKKVCISHRVRLAVKAKSITSEEIGLNKELIDAGIEVAETDLAEFILQVSKEQPSHFIAPAIHRSRESISELFKRNFRTDLPLDTGEELTRFARDILRKKFLSADVGITGANLLAAEDGAILLVESEGNIRLTTQLPAIHIALAGIEKIIPRKKDFGLFIELLAASGTGQPLTSYTNILEPPIDLPVLNLNGRSDQKREFYLILIDNGRMKMRQDEDLKEALYCIRCSACLNSCANFQVVGGHAFGGECYTGGIGGAWTLGTSGSLEKTRFVELCTGCSRCVPNCPVKIDIPRLNTVIKSRLTKAAGGPSIQQYFFGYFSGLARLAIVAHGISNWFNNLSVSRTVMEKIVGIDKRRAIPPFAEETLAMQYRNYRKNNNLADGAGASSRLVLFDDVYTHYNNPEIGMSIVRVFDKLGLPITLSELFDDGRGLQSQGLVEKAEQRARELTPYLVNLVNQDKDIIVAEPSVLAMFRYDYKNLLKNETLFKKLANHSFDPIEYLNGFIVNGSLDISNHLKKNLSPAHRIFYHAHCQLKSIGGTNAVQEFFGRIGFTVDISNVECCGMAGSFGYKKEYYEISKRVGDDLINQIKATFSNDRDIVILANGVSCREQIGSEISNAVYHPIQFLETLLS